MSKLLLIIILGITVSCAKSGGNSKPQAKPETKPVTTEEVETPVTPSFTETFKDIETSNSKKVIFSEQVSDIKKIELKIQKARIARTTVKSYSQANKACQYKSFVSTIYNSTIRMNVAYCTDQATYDASKLSGKGVGLIAKGSQYSLTANYKKLEAWTESPFKDDLTLDDLGLEIFINDKFYDVGTKDIKVNEDSGNVELVTVEIALPDDALSGNLKIVANPVFESQSVKTGYQSPTLYTCKSPYNNISAKILATANQTSGTCKVGGSTDDYLKYAYLIGSYASKTESITPKTRFDLELTVQGVREKKEEE